MPEIAATHGDSVASGYPPCHCLSADFHAEPGLSDDAPKPNPVRGTAVLTGETVRARNVVPNAVYRDASRLTCRDVFGKHLECGMLVCSEWYRRRSLDADLVALRIRHHDDVVIFAHDASSKRHQAAHLLGATGERSEVKVLTILGRLALGYAHEPEGRSSPSGRFDPGPVRRAVLVDVGPEGSRPEGRHYQRLSAVEGD